MMHEQVSALAPGSSRAGGVYSGALFFSRGDLSPLRSTQRLRSANEDLQGVGESVDAGINERQLKSKTKRF